MSLPALPLGWAARAFAVTADVYGVGREALTSRGRRDELMIARLACYAGMRLAGAPYEAIGEQLERDHTTVIAGCRRASEIAAADPAFAATVQRIATAAATRPPRLPLPAASDAGDGTMSGELEALRGRVAELERQIAQLAELVERGLSELALAVGGAS
jgi:hypothetical protein